MRAAAAPASNAQPRGPDSASATAVAAFMMFCAQAADCSDERESLVQGFRLFLTQEAELFSQVGDENSGSTEDGDGASQGTNLALDRVRDIADSVYSVEDESEAVYGS